MSHTAVALVTMIGVIILVALALVGRFGP